ncbi:MAG TPA: sporulation protein [Lachnospiraceae bacterium]|nr:sporulation protein [Lachnospiraceae bacterium]
MAENDFQTTVESLYQGINQFISSKTVVGEPIHLGDTIILPLVDVSFAVGAGAAAGSSKNANNSGGGMGGKINPCAVLVISNGSTKLVNVKSSDGLSKILDMVPDFVNKITGNSKAENATEDIDIDSVDV